MQKYASIIFKCVRYIYLITLFRILSSVLHDKIIAKSIVCKQVCNIEKSIVFLRENMVYRVNILKTIPPNKRHVTDLKKSIVCRASYQHSKIYF